MQGEGIKKWKTQVGLAVGDRLRLHRRPDQPNSSSGGGITLDIERVLPVPPGTQLRAAQVRLVACVFTAALQQLLPPACYPNVASRLPAAARAGCR